MEDLCVALKKFHFLFTSLPRNVPIDSELVYWLSKVTLEVFPEAPQKMREVVDAKRFGLVVNKALLGHDAVDAFGKVVELKNSTIWPDSKKCNVMWKLPEGKTNKERRQKLIDSVDTKAAGGAHFVLVTNTGTMIKSYYFYPEFLKLYFAHVKITSKTKNVNMGSSFCHQCGTCERLDRLQTIQSGGGQEKDMIDFFASKSFHEHKIEAAGSDE